MHEYYSSLPNFSLLINVSSYGWENSLNDFSLEFMRAFLDHHVRCFMEFTLKLKVQIL